MGSVYNWDMKREGRRQRKLYIDIIAVIAVTVLLAVFFTWKFQQSSERKVLNTLSEISCQSVNVIQEEVEKNKTLLTNLAIYISEGDTKDIDVLIEGLVNVDKRNGFKRMGIIRDDYFGKATDGRGFVPDRESIQERFQAAMEGKTVVSDRLKDLDDGKDVTLYSTPINWPDGTRYVLFGTYGIEYYKEILSVSTFGGEGYSYIIRKNGDCVIDSKNKNGNSFENYYDHIIEESEGNREGIRRLQEDIDAFRDGFVTFQTEKGSRYVYYQPLEINDWYLMSVIPEAVVETHINGPMATAYAILLVCLLGILYLACRVYLIQKAGRKMLERAAYVDEVTGDASYAKFMLDAQKLLHTYTDKKYALAVLNIKRFQYINDLYGYEEGDRALKRVMKALREAVGTYECAARMQSDHYAVLLVYEDQNQLQERLDMILEKIECEADNRVGGTPYVLKVQAGVYMVQQREEMLESMLDRAAMAARSEYNPEINSCNFYSETIRRRMLRNREIEDRFSEALKNQEFYLCYQPKFQVEVQRFCGAEALVRWEDPKTGAISPAEFIPVLEHSGSIVELDEFVLEMACSQIHRWLQEGIEVLPVSVNVSQLHLYRLNFVERYLEIIDRHQIPHELIQLEMTETALFSNEDILSESLEELRSRGIRILMDDFGSGYSSVTMLKSMPIDILKIDKSMVDSVEDNEKVRLILSSIIRLAQSLHISVTAEGVENKAQYEILKSMKIDDIQGYYCARPMSADQYACILKSPQKKYEF